MYVAVTTLSVTPHTDLITVFICCHPTAATQVTYSQLTSLNKLVMCYSYLVHTLIVFAEWCLFVQWKTVWYTMMWTLHSDMIM